MENNKKVIELSISTDFVDALFAGTNLNTLAVEFDKSLAEIAKHINRYGTISVESTVVILGWYNAKGNYDVQKFVETYNKEAK